MSTRQSKPFELYREAVVCPLECEGVCNDRAGGRIPRSFLFCAPRRSITTLVVGKNPAQAPQWERELYIQTSDLELAEATIGVAKDLFWGTKVVPSNFHVNFIERVAAVIGVEPTAEAVFSKVALTALAKCESASEKTDVLTTVTMQRCSDRYLWREIAYFEPKYLIALGKEVFDFLERSRVVGLHNLPVGKLYHPSWSNMKGGKAEYFATEIPRLRKEYEAACAKYA